MVTVDINSASLAYVERGSGEPVVFVHGSASDHRTWHLQHDEFGRSFRAIIYSRRHHWPNNPIAEGIDYSMAEHVDDLEALLQSLDATPAHVVGIHTARLSACCWPFRHRNSSARLCWPSRRPLPCL